MSAWQQLSALFVLVPIAFLLSLGLFLAVRSGGEVVGAGHGARAVALNLTSVLLRVAGYVAGMLALHHFIGAPIAFGW